MNRDKLYYIKKTFGVDVNDNNTDLVSLVFSRESSDKLDVLNRLTKLDELSELCDGDLKSLEDFLVSLKVHKTNLSAATALVNKKFCEPEPEPEPEPVDESEEIAELLADWR